MTIKRKAEAAWASMHWADKQQQWEATIAALRSASASSSWQQRAQTAEARLVQLLEELLPLPDPLPVIERAAALLQRLAGRVQQVTWSKGYAAC